MRSVPALTAIAMAAAATATTAAESTTAAAATKAATAAAAAESAACALFLGTSLIDGELAAAEFGAVDLFSRCFGLFFGPHGHEGKAARASRHLVHGDVDVGDCAELAEVRAKFVFRGLEGQVPNVEFGVTHLLIS